MSGWPGLRTDCEGLLQHFQNADSVRFEDFALLWKQHRFHTIFYGKIRPLEQTKFSKEALALVWPYFLPPHAFQIRVGALYLLYGLYNMQLCQPKQKIRVSLKDWEEVQKFQQELLDARHYDAAYVFRKLRVDKAFYFTAMPKLLSFRTKKNMDSSTETKQEFKGPDDRVAGLSTADCLEEMQNVHDHYQKMKCLISMDQSQPDKALNLIKDDFVTNFRDIISEYQQWQKNKESPFITAGEEAMKAKEGSSRESEGSERARALADIKFKSYSAVAQASKSRRHRQVKLESSEYESDHRKSPRGKRARKRLQPVRRKETQQNRGALQAIKEEGVGRILSMPVITEDEEDDDAEEDHHSSDEAFVPFKRKRTR
ncbi:snRNA-activating protein complex subunit 1 isoform X2 [Hemicordylus capensis]|uniref:snRNA-activating protein complex subunit 1 isoform X2 n=1 Tax=Hemicordylus capensis TaxID=884348 RepID=UPI00230440B4|nr:snRNA-activating protein complex subunit 1 isoform X2 [Hemicordylus capensis]